MMSDPIPSGYAVNYAVRSESDVLGSTLRGVVFRAPRELRQAYNLPEDIDKYIDMLETMAKAMCGEEPWRDWVPNANAALYALAMEGCAVRSTPPAPRKP